ncbi:MAG: triose-phosphate isomerase [Chitinophagaceae bacterium]
MRNKYAIANWKMHLTKSEVLKYAKNFVCPTLPDNKHAVVCVPFPYLDLALTHLNKIAIGAQNCADHASGAYTGEVSAMMLASMPIKYVIIGHSERREYYQETHNILIKKIKLALENGLTPVFCCGESLAIRESRKHNEFVAQQIKNIFPSFTHEELTKFIIAYEPIWAIGTGKTASTEQAEAMHQHIRNAIAEFSQSLADGISILYGGSVKSNNAKELFSSPNVDGGLIGGASLQPDQFIEIIKAL